MNVVSTLNEELLRQPFKQDLDELTILTKYQQIAYGYSIIENSIAVLSDFKSNRSYIYSGRIAQELGIAGKEDVKMIDSIWEEELFNKIHPDDLIQKHLLELRFFHLLKTFPLGERSDYHITSKIRMLDKAGEYVSVRHRMFYVYNSPSGNLGLALCLYNFSHEESTTDTDGMIVNSATGNIVNLDKDRYKDILSAREKEILVLIEEGKMSKEIADLLSISKNTVNRHRQNILEKLRVKNSFEACRTAKRMSLL